MDSAAPVPAAPAPAAPVPAASRVVFRNPTPVPPDQRRPPPASLIQPPVSSHASAAAALRNANRAGRDWLHNWKAQRLQDRASRDDAQKEQLQKDLRAARAAEFSKVTLKYDTKKVNRDFARIMAALSRQ